MTTKKLHRLARQAGLRLHEQSGAWLIDDGTVIRRLDGARTERLALIAALRRYPERLTPEQREVVGATVLQ